MKKLCKHFDLLDPIMRDRPSVQPVATSETLASQLDIWTKSSDQLIASRRDHDKKMLAIEQGRLEMEQDRHKSDATRRKY